MTDKQRCREAFEKWFIKLGLTSDDLFALTSAIKAFSFIAWQAGYESRTQIPYNEALEKVADLINSIPIAYERYDDSFGGEHILPECEVAKAAKEILAAMGIEEGK